MSNKSLTDRVRVIYTYSTSHLSKTDLVRFFYALKGRDGKSGILKATQAEFLAKSVLLCSRTADPEIQQFFEHWRCKYERRVLLESKKPTAALITYSTKNLSASDLVRFYYALKGRDGSLGILKETKTKQLARAVLIVPATQISEIKDFFAHWNVKIKKMEVRELNA